MIKQKKINEKSIENMLKLYKDILELKEHKQLIFHLKTKLFVIKRLDDL